jgi:hypothetical protein
MVRLALPELLGMDLGAEHVRDLIVAAILYHKTGWLASG